MLALGGLFIPAARESAEMMIENGLYYRRDVTMLEDRTRMTKGRMGQAMAWVNNLILGILLHRHKSRYIPAARRFFDAHPQDALALITRL